MRAGGKKKIPYITGSLSGVILPLTDFGPCLNTVLIVATKRSAQCPTTPKTVPLQRMTQPKMPAVPSLRNPNQTVQLLGQG